MKVISFALWGSDERFLNGALQNIVLAKSSYPGWTCVIYLHEGSPSNWAQQLESAGFVVYKRGTKKGEWEGLFWRFEPIFNPEVSCTIVRDCDSRVNPREVAAVRQWLHSGRFFHVMRDHYEHNMPIMGGMFGCHYWAKFENLLSEWKDFGCKGDDQRFLADKVWPEIRSRSLVHDRYAEGLSMPNKDGNGSYEYKPLEHFGDHLIMKFPAHEGFDASVYGEHVGARVGVA